MKAENGYCKFCRQQDGLMVSSKSNQLQAHFTCILLNNQPYQVDSDRVLFDTSLNKCAELDVCACFKDPGSLFKLPNS